jgi:hypothetical protein
MIAEFILAELSIWAGMIALLPLAVAIAILLANSQARRRHGDWPRVGHRVRAAVTRRRTASLHRKAATVMPAQRGP